MKFSLRLFLLGVVIAGGAVTVYQAIVDRSVRSLGVAFRGENIAYTGAVAAIGGGIAQFGQKIVRKVV